jgi:hypothetical protein
MYCKVFIIFLLCSFFIIPGTINSDISTNWSEIPSLYTNIFAFCVGSHVSLTKSQLSDIFVLFFQAQKFTNILNSVTNSVILGSSKMQNYTNLLPCPFNTFSQWIGNIPRAHVDFSENLTYNHSC